MTSQTRSAAGRPSRRTALGMGVGAATVLATASCALNNPLHADRTPAARAVRDLEPDVAVAVEAAALLRTAQAAASATAARHPGLAARLAGLLATHRAHLDRVSAAVPEGVDLTATATPYVVPERPAAALAQLGTAERSLHDGLIGLAMRARSGPFARLLGAMAAATSQQLQGLAG